MARTITLYWWSPLNFQCRKAREVLSQKGVSTFEERDFFKRPLLRGRDSVTLLKGHTPSDIFSWRSPSFKALGLEAVQP